MLKTPEIFIDATNFCTIYIDCRISMSFPAETFTAFVYLLLVLIVVVVVDDDNDDDDDDDAMCNITSIFS